MAKSVNRRNGKQLNILVVWGEKMSEVGGSS